jgi:hypothetical protein
MDDKPPKIEPPHWLQRSDEIWGPTNTWNHKEDEPRSVAEDWDRLWPLVVGVALLLVIAFLWVVVMLWRDPL